MEKHAFDDWKIKLMMDAVWQAKCVSVDEATVIRDKLLSLTSNRGRSRFSHLMRVKSENLEDDIKYYKKRDIDSIKVDN